MYASKRGLLFCHLYRSRNLPHHLRLTQPTPLASDVGEREPFATRHRHAVHPQHRIVQTSPPNTTRNTIGCVTLLYCTVPVLHCIVTIHQTSRFKQEQ